MKSLEALWGRAGAHNHRATVIRGAALLALPRQVLLNVGMMLVQRRLALRCRGPGGDYRAATNFKSDYTQSPRLARIEGSGRSGRLRRRCATTGLSHRLHRSPEWASERRHPGAQTIRGRQGTFG